MWEIRRHGKPMTFADIRAAAIGDDRDVKLSASFERSLRRALHRLAHPDVALLIAMGDGGPGDPLRYFIHPMAIAFMGKTPEALALQAALEADPGANEAAARCMAKMFPAAAPAA